MNRTNIGWCDVSWNPVVGCRRGCPWCYAHRIHTVRHRAKIKGARLPNQYSKPFSAIQFIPERLNDPDLKSQKPRTIFVGSMSDIEYWKRDHTRLIMQVCANHSQHTFMFLSKNPGSYSGFNWPANTMQGLTMTCGQPRQVQDTITGLMAKYPRPFISIEPLLGELKTNIIGFEKIIVGAMTGKDAVAPKKEWIDNIREKIPEHQIFWKSNIKKYL